MRLLLIVALTGACAQAHQEGLTNGRPDGGGIHVTDSSNGGGDDGNNTQMDAPNQQMDAPMQGGTQTLTETTGNTDTQVGIACASSAGYTLRNSYYRVFTLSDYGVTGAFHVTGVDFIVSAAASSPSLTVGIGTYTGTAGGQTITKANISITQSVPYSPGNTTTAVPVHVPIAADITGNLVVEIDQSTAGSTGTPYQFYIGANESGESKPGYISSADCSLAVPTSMDYEAQQQMTPTHSNMVLTVTGST
jgi:hypothetical protein